MIYGILGDLEVRDSGGGLVELPPRRARAVLATLLLRANSALSAGELIAAAWGDRDIDAAQLYKAVAALRKVFTAAGRPGALRTLNRYGYELRVDDGDLDMLVFRRLVRQADERRGNSPAEAALLREALAQWRSGRPLSNMHLETLTGEIEALRRQRRRAATRLFDLEIERGAHAEVADELTAFAAEYPEDAKLCRLLMTALDRDGRTEEILPAIERYEDAAVSPDKSLRRLAYRMVSASGAPGPAPLVPRQLPPPPAYFVGRDGLLAEVLWLLREPRLPVLAISGPGGMGKTALALRAAHEVTASYPDGQLWAGLRGTEEQPADPAEVLGEFLRALGVPSVPETLHERATLYRSTMAGRRMLVLLDDAADGAQVRDLLPGGGRSVVLITARRRMPDIGAPAHHVAPLGAFDDETAGELFHRIVADAHVDLAGEEDAIGEVVRLCAGLPLAVRMAAFLRVEAFHRSTGELLRQLTVQGPTAFAYGAESLARTLGAGLIPLDDRARRLFVGLGLLALPTFAEWTAAAVLDEPGPAAGDALAQLAAAGMADPVPGVARYRFHDLTREYARGLATTSATGAGDLAGAAVRVGRALLTLARRAHAALYGGDFDIAHSDLADVAVPAAELASAASEPRVWFQRERANIRAAVEQAAALGQAALCWDLAVSAHEFYAIGSYFDDWRATHEIALEACRAAGDRRGEGVVLTMLGMPPLVASGSAGVSGVNELARAVHLLSETGERHVLAVAQRTLANALRRNGELARPLELFTEALAHYQESGDLVGSQQALRFIGQTHLDLGDAPSAVEVLLEASRVARRTASARVVAPALYWLGQAHLARGDLGAAEAAFHEVLSLSPPSSGVAHAYALHGLGDLALAQGDAAEARALLSDAAVFAREGSDAGLEARVVLSLAAASASLGLDADRVDILRGGSYGGSAKLAIRVQAELADAYARLGDAKAAREARERVVELYDRGDVPSSDRRVLP
jgi:DNA-binding SARP family transcriptional activator/tetratricopeptide (TPR) repeat protein